MLRPALPDQVFETLGSTDADAINLGRFVTDQGIGEKMLYGGQLHTLCFGANGTGKSTRLILPNLLEMRGRSIVVIDPKGELAAISAPYRRSLGEEVVIINPFGVLTDLPGYEDLKSDGFNPLLALDPASPSFNADASLLAEALISVDTGGNAKHFDTSARNLIAALIMYVCIKAPETGQVPQLVDVRGLLNGAGTPSSVDKKGHIITELALEMMASDVRGLRNKAAQFEEWSPEIASVVSTARTQTEPFDDNEIADDLGRGTFDMRELKKRPVTVYIILPPEMMNRHSKWLRFVIAAALRGVMRRREPHEPRTLFILDEFAALGHMEIIETVWALVRGYGIQIMPILQDLNQLKGLYRERWETFIGMAGAVLSFGARDMTSAKWMSERAGDRTELAMGFNTGSSENKGGEGVSEGLSYQQIKIPLITPHNFMAMEEGYLCLWLARIADTIHAYAPAYYQVDKLAARAPRSPYYNG